MPKLPQFKPKELVAILKKSGFVEKQQTGSHLIMFNPELRKIIPVPMHNKPIGKGLLHSIIKQAGIKLN
ncbi:MAG: hypothetical protein UR93_C0029G0007 [Berkelbacteria bacterium GW2011_GWA2_35_9]|uniref:YcfA family protein n=1 Tax=Berkelbacteria bacterium GW2011_GWA2_35_9 TaxID=1618333 RepID=A0A0G0DGJ8_9BACT|nr:MAG: hypothetical protein UR93_C0029G0007 [Berkelbacteria bacterium GW2011_GWA2_35_9]